VRARLETWAKARSDIDDMYFPERPRHLRSTSTAAVPIAQLADVLAMAGIGSTRPKRSFAARGMTSDSGRKRTGSLGDHVFEKRPFRRRPRVGRHDVRCRRPEADTWLQRRLGRISPKQPSAVSRLLEQSGRSPALESAEKDLKKAQATRYASNVRAVIRTSLQFATPPPRPPSR
jgi:hypothetical protein